MGEDFFLGASQGAGHAVRRCAAGHSQPVSQSAGGHMAWVHGRPTRGGGPCRPVMAKRKQAGWQGGEEAVCASCSSGQGAERRPRGGTGNGACTGWHLAEGCPGLETVVGTGGGLHPGPVARSSLGPAAVGAGLCMHACVARPSAGSGMASGRRQCRVRVRIARTGRDVWVWVCMQSDAFGGRGRAARYNSTIAGNRDRGRGPCRMMLGHCHIDNWSRQGRVPSSCSSRFRTSRIR